MFRNHEIEYISKNIWAKTWVSRKFGHGHYEIQFNSKVVTVRFQHGEYKGIVEPHGSVLSRKVWKWKNDGKPYL